MTGLLYDPDLFARHNKPQHAENAARMSRLGPFDEADPVPARAATDPELLAVHTPAYLARVAAKCAAGGGMLDPDTYCGPDSEIVSRSVCGGLIDLCAGVLRGDHANGLAVTRPPGHHATSDQAMGFCLYNHVAVAAAALLAQGLQRVAILDFDVHHGNGTQDIFYDQESVLYLSTHQFPHYPGTGAAHEIGRGPGLSYTLNCPLPAGAGDDEFLAAHRQQLLPALVAYRPEFILISAGYDAHEADPLAGLRVTTDGFTTVVKMLLEAAADVCAGRIVFALEGGYDPTALAECVNATYRAVTAASSPGASGTIQEFFGMP